MGEIADAMVNGLLCEWCGVYVDGEEPGYPRLCEDCLELPEAKDHCSHKENL